MVTKVFRRGALAVLAYAVGLALLIILQFSRNTGFFESADGISIRGFYRAQAGESEKAPVIDSVSASIPGFVFEFSGDKPLAYTDSSGKGKTALPLSYAKKGKAFVVSFENGLALTFGAEDERIAVSLSGAAQAILRYSNKPSFDEKSKPPALLLQGGIKVGLRTGDVDVDAGTVKLSSFRPFTLSFAKTGESSSLVSVMDQAPMNPSMFANALSRYFDKAWLGWSATRFKASTVQWKGEAGYAFSETAAAAYLAEGFKRGKGPETLEAVKPARSLYPSKLGYLTSPYLGNLVPAMRLLEQADAAEIRKIKEYLQTQNPDLFLKEGIVGFLFDRTPYALAQEASSFAQKAAAEKFSVAQAVGFLSAMVESRAFYKDDANPFIGHEGVTERILASIRKTPDGFFLDSGDGSCNVRMSVLAGWKLVDWGRLTDREVFVGVGQSLVVSALALADDDGSLPLSIDLRDGTATQRTGRLEAESVYPIVADNPRYPREISFYNVAGPGVWAWSVAPSLMMTMNNGVYTFKAEYGASYTHFLCIYGLKPFKVIRLYGIPYNADPKFESYDASGYIYSASANGLYLKMKHKKESEVIVLEY